MPKQRSLDVDKVTSALKRAAVAATTGNRDQRSGKFTAANAARKTPTTAVAETVKTSKK